MSSNLDHKTFVNAGTLKLLTEVFQVSNLDASNWLRGLSASIIKYGSPRVIIDTEHHAASQHDVAPGQTSSIILRLKLEAGQHNT